MNADLNIWVDRYMKGHRIGDGCLICRLVAEIEAQDKRIESLEANLLNESEAHHEWRAMAEQLQKESEKEKTDGDI
jgi:hypothetical protein